MTNGFLAIIGGTRASNGAFFGGGTMEAGGVILRKTFPLPGAGSFVVNFLTYTENKSNKIEGLSIRGVLS